MPQAQHVAPHAGKALCVGLDPPLTTCYVCCAALCLLCCAASPQLGGQHHMHHFMGSSGGRLPEWPPAGSMGRSPGMMFGSVFGSTPPMGRSVDMVDMCTQLMEAGGAPPGVGFWKQQVLFWGRMM